MMLNDAWWITNRGDMLRLDQYHVGAVIKNPELFGYTTEKLKKIYAKYNEPYSPTLEGKAREEILYKLMKKKYIRIRKKISGDYSIQLDALNPKMGDRLWLWANKESKDAFDKFADVTIHLLKGNKMIRTSLDQLASGATIKESIGGERRLLTAQECEKIKVYTEDEMDQLPDYFEYAEDFIDEDTEQWVIDEILEHKNSTMMKHLK